MLMNLHGVASTRDECAKMTIENSIGTEMGGGTYTFFTLEKQVGCSAHALRANPCSRWTSGVRTDQ